MLKEIHYGDCRKVMVKLEKRDVKVQACVTSPPYFGLRDYGHVDQIGLEDRVPKYIETLTETFDGVYKLLKDDGVLFVNIGDSYASHRDGKFVPQSMSKGDLKGLPKTSAPNRNTKLLKKDGFRHKELLGIPFRFALAMRERGWLLRQDIIWSKDNYTPESMTDRFVRSHEYIFMFTKQSSYFFQSDKIQIPAEGGGKKLRPSVIRTPVSSYKGAHFATFPQELVTPLILGATNEGDTVLDIFLGSGTVAQVANNHRRGYLGIELNPEYKDLIDKRLRNNREVYKGDALGSVKTRRLFG